MLLINTTKNVSHTEINTTTLPLDFIYTSNTVLMKETSIRISSDIFSEEYLLNDAKVKSDSIFKNNILRNSILTGMSCAYLLSSSKNTDPTIKDEEGETESDNIVLGEITIPVVFGKYYQNIFKISDHVLDATPIERVSGLINAYRFHILRGILFGRCISMKKANLKIDFNNGTAIRVILKPQVREGS